MYMGDIRGGGGSSPLISSVMESLMSAQDWLYGVLDGAKYPQTKANTIKRSGHRDELWVMLKVMSDAFIDNNGRALCVFSRL